MFMLWSALQSVLWILSWLLSPVTPALLVIGFLIGYVYLTRHRHYWSSRRVYHLAHRFPLGHVGVEVLRRPRDDIMADIYRRAKAAGGFMPMYDVTGPALCAADPALVRQIMMDKCYHFSATQCSMMLNNNLFERMLTSLSGQEWEHMRKLWAPMFAGEGLGLLSAPLETLAERLAGRMLEESQAAAGAVEIGEMFGRYVIDGVAAMTISLDSRAITSKSVMTRMAAALNPNMPSWKRLVSSLILPLPEWLKNIVPVDKFVPHCKAIGYFSLIIRLTIYHRCEKPSQRRPDFLQSLLDARKGGHTNPASGLSDEDILAQCLLFYIAGYDSTKRALVWAARCLALHPDTQQKLQAEIDRSLPQHTDGIGFDTLSSMSYLDSVVREALRLLPAKRLTRQCRRPYRVPGTDLTLPAGTGVYVHVQDMHRDPDLFPRPEMFHPDRFGGEAGDSRHPPVYIPFGAGPRHCIGKPVAVLLVKLALVAILRRYTLSVGPKRRDERPWLKESFSSMTESCKAWLQISKRKG